MKIDLRSVPVVVVTTHTPKYERRMAWMVRVLAGLGMRPPLPVYGPVGHNGCEHGHALAASADVPAPYLILEDDARPSRNFKPVHDVPDDADLVYLGLNTYRPTRRMMHIHRRIYRGRTRASLFGLCLEATPHKGWLRWVESSATHAILVVTEKGRKVLQDSAAETLKHDTNIDTVIGVMAHESGAIVYTPDNIQWFQGTAIRATWFPPKKFVRPRAANFP